MRTSGRIIKEFMDDGMNEKMAEQLFCAIVHEAYINLRYAATKGVHHDACTWNGRGNSARYLNRRIEGHMFVFLFVFGTRQVMSMTS